MCYGYLFSQASCAQVLCMEIAIIMVIVNDGKKQLPLENVAFGNFLNFFLIPTPKNWRNNKNKKMEKITCFRFDIKISIKM